jgi:hypothetical protein
VAILIVFAGTASFADAYWIEPDWIKTEEVVIYRYVDIGSQTG